MRPTGWAGTEVRGAPEEWPARRLHVRAEGGAREGAVGSRRGIYAMHAAFCGFGPTARERQNWGFWAPPTRYHHVLANKSFRKA